MKRAFHVGPCGLRLLLLGAMCAALLFGCRHIRPPRGRQPVARALLATAYCACGECCGWRRTWYGKPVYASGRLKGKRKRVGVTASGTMARPGCIAADTRFYPFGTVMYIPGYGYGVVEDRGGKIKGHHVDLFFKRHRDAVKWGRRKVAANVWLPNPG